MNTYTVVCDFRGGTYISQVSARAPSKAVEAWCDLLLAEQTLGDETSAVTAKVREELDDDHPVPLDGLKNVWCLTASAGDDLVLVNLVLTVSA